MDISAINATASFATRLKFNDKGGGFGTNLFGHWEIRQSFGDEKLMITSVGASADTGDYCGVFLHLHRECIATNHQGDGMVVSNYQEVYTD
jgi:hypothetical protein